MFTSDFANRLKLVCPDLQVNFAGRNFNINQEQGTCAVYELGKWVEIEEKDHQYLEGEARKIAKREKLYLCYVAAEYMPEHSRYNPQLVCITPGYRDVLHQIVKQRPKHREKIEKVFGFRMFQSDWDFQSPLVRAKRQETKIKTQKTAEQLQNTGYFMDRSGVSEIEGINKDA